MKAGARREGPEGKGRIQLDEGNRALIGFWSQVLDATGRYENSNKLSKAVYQVQARKAGTSAARISKHELIEDEACRGGGKHALKILLLVQAAVTL